MSRVTRYDLGRKKTGQKMATIEEGTVSKVFLVKTKINPTNDTARFVETVEINGNPCAGRAYLINRKESRQSLRSRKNRERPRKLGSGDLSLCRSQRDTVER